MTRTHVPVLALSTNNWEPVSEHAPEAPARLCRDCKFFAPVNGIDEHAFCNAPQNFRHVISLVTGKGEPKRNWDYCSTQRTSQCSDACQASARWFEPAERVS